MKKRLLFNAAILLVAVLLVQDSRAQDYIRWGLPEGAKIRLGKGQLSGAIAYPLDGTRLAVVSTIGIWLYDTYGGAEVALLTDRGHFRAFAPDGATFASTSRDTIRLWDVNTGQLKNTLEHTDRVEAVAFSPDGNILASAGWGNAVQLWNAETGQFKISLDHSKYVVSVAFAPDGKTITDGYRLWDANTGQEKATLDHSRGLTSVAFSPNGTTIAGASSNGTVQLWDANTGQSQAILEAHGDGVYSVAFAPDGKTIACGRNNDIIQLWDVDTGQLKNTLEGHMYVVESVAFSPDGTTLASGSLDGTVQLWDTDTGQSQAILQGHRYGTLSVAFAPDGNTLASGSMDGTILLWDMSPYITPSVPTTIELSPTLPTQTALIANYPNPFNPDTYIPYQLHAPAHVRLTIYDIRGASVRGIDLGYQQAGRYLTSTSAAHWDGRNQFGQRVASGVYVYQLQAGPVVLGRKMLLVK